MDQEIKNKLASQDAKLDPEAQQAQKLAASLAKTSGCGSCDSCGSCAPKNPGDAAGR